MIKAWTNAVYFIKRGICEINYPRLFLHQLLIGKWFPDRSANFYSEMVVKVHCGTVWGDEFATLLKTRSQNSPTMHLKAISTRSTAQPQSGQSSELVLVGQLWSRRRCMFPHLTNGCTGNVTKHTRAFKLITLCYESTEGYPAENVPWKFVIMRWW